MKVEPDLLATKQWIFPLNRPKRDYQFNISKHCLFDNTLVALPTGLGKTFIAGVVMLNFYRWFPDGKIVFVAPTKPLVAQQIDACHQTCGIPGRDAAELTGNVPKAQRNRAWAEKRVFYMTPQTLFNDLYQNNCDCRDIVLLVIDEAHKGSGDYAYATCVRYLMAKNPHFRVLALTATPGSNPEAVQGIVDSLHISRIEIRDEQSWDIRGYINKKKVEQHIITMNDDIARLRDMIGKVMKPMLQKLANVGIFRGNLDPVLFHPFRAQSAMGEIHGRKDGRQLAWAFPVLKKVGALARAMGYLLEASQMLCHRSLKEAVDGDNNSDKAKSGNNKLTNDPNFQAIMRELDLQAHIGFAVHPKMEKLKMLVLNHFGTKLPEEAADANNGEAIGAGVNGVGAGGNKGSEGDDTRVMVFVTFREAVEQLVEFLNEESPIIRATKFIGQGADKAGKKGFAQKDQLDVIKRFKQGEFNVLVSTSIGEEGLDIGEIDMIVCYESQKTPIRMLQRVGRTGRKRDGYVHVLLAEGREELNWNKAQESYANVQKSIVRGEQLEFYADVERLLPDHIKPEPLEMEMDIEPYDREEATEKKGRSSSTNGQGSAKRKRNGDAERNIPEGASKGFVSVADLLLKGSGKKRKMSSVAELLKAGEEDSTDDEIEAGIFGARRTVSMPARSEEQSEKTKGKEKEKRSVKRKKTTEGKEPKVKKKKTKAERTALPSVPLSQANIEDEDDLAIEQGFLYDDAAQATAAPSARKRRKSVDPPSRSPARVSSPDMPLADGRSSPDVPLASQQSVIDVCTPSERDSPASPPAHIPSPSNTKARHKSMAKSKSAPARASTSRSPSNRGSPRALDDNVNDKTAGRDLSWLLADSSDGDGVGRAFRSLSPQVHKPSVRSATSSSDIEFVDDPPPVDVGFVRSSTLLRRSNHSPTNEDSDLPGSDIEIEDDEFENPIAQNTVSVSVSSESSKSHTGHSPMFKSAHQPGDTPPTPLQDEDEDDDPLLLASPKGSPEPAYPVNALGKKRKLSAFVEPSSPLVAPSHSSDQPEDIDDLQPSQPVRAAGGRKKRVAVNDLFSSPSATAMPPSPSQKRLRRPPSPAAEESEDGPQPTFPVRAAGGRKKRVTAKDPLSSPVVMPPPSQKRLRRPQDSPPLGSMGPPDLPKTPKVPKSRISRPTSKKLKFRDAAEAARANPWIDVEASHSGDDVSGGEYSDDDDLARLDHSSEDGHGFIANDGSFTQASPSYDQYAVYRQSLMSQAPSRAGPVFRSRPRGRGAAFRGDGVGEAGSSRRRNVTVSSSPRRSDEEPDEYAFGSFAVDDEDISFAPSSDL
ncbi:P-loop containing nucleoside triphosphate hydrolase protein [Stereum hirsutum FP-91666 SS1]|uniref:P-loop containing nucleoside triphosphate hydrolase protein n=1 Tax=Stereum hirsutum (strain FP-91666) TaxID=721885 RepID=UPI000444972C|nr:P-loop containing nucleoside triphosphate hydrolase protein [Stereum hirsutum FP-91666 SS1]EIM83347.1 P-loop containing nucleoside triphosphate hydrolase protein [Stereum hirsutum FP-91666 SS1]